MYWKLCVLNKILVKFKLDYWTFILCVWLGCVQWGEGVGALGNSNWGKAGKRFAVVGHRWRPECRVGDASGPSATSPLLSGESTVAFLTVMSLWWEHRCEWICRLLMLMFTWRLSKLSVSWSSTKCLRAHCVAVTCSTELVQSEQEAALWLHMDVPVGLQTCGSFGWCDSVMPTLREKRNLNSEPNSPLKSFLFRHYLPFSALESWVRCSSASEWQTRETWKWRVYFQL